MAEGTESTGSETTAAAETPATEKTVETTEVKKIASFDFDSIPVEDGSNGTQTQETKDSSSTETKAPDTAVFTPSSYWETLGLDVPEGTNAENEKENIKKVYDENLSKGAAENPALSKLPADLAKAMENENFSFDNYVKQRNTVNNLDKYTTDQLAKASVIKEFGIKSNENPTGLSNEEVDAEVNRMSLLERKRLANEFKTSYRSEQEQHTATQNAKVAENENKKIQEDLNNLNTKVKNIDYIYGHEVQPEAVEKYFTDFKSQFNTDTEGNRPIANFLDNVHDSDENIFLSWVLHEKFGGLQGIKDLISGNKSKSTEDVKEKLRITQRQDKGGSSGQTNHNPNSFDDIPEG